MHALSRPLAWLFAALSLVLTPNCALDQADEADEADEADNSHASAEGVLVSAVSYSLEWSTEGIAYRPQGGFTLTTNLGYELTITRGFHVLHGASLGQCPKPATSAFLGIRAAYAHTEEEDPSALETLSITDLSQKPSAREIGASAFAPARYCHAFALLARGMKGAVGPDGTDLENRSAYFEGSYKRGAQSGSFVLDTWWPQSRLVALKDVTEPLVYARAAKESGPHFAFVTIRVPLGSAFDDIDFETDILPAKLDTLVDNLATRAEIVVDLQAP